MISTAEPIFVVRSILRRLAIAVLAGLVLVAPVAASAEDDGDHDLARDLHERGEIRALSDILHVVREHAPGDVVAVGLIRLGEKWVYRFQIVGSDGRRTTVDVDAGAGAVIRGEGG